MGGATRRLLAGTVLAAALTTGGLLTVASAAEAATVTGTVQVSGTLTVRTGPSTTAASAGPLRNGAKIAIACYTHGASVNGTVRTTTIWDRLTSGDYVSHAYVRSAALTPCAAAASYVPGAVKTNDGPVNLRAGASRGAALSGQAANGAKLAISCAVTGDYVTGTVRSTNQWDRLTNGRYLSHAYVVSPAVPTCTGGTTGSVVPSQSNAQYIAAAVPGAQRGWREFGVPPSVTIAQSILESGWGRSGLAARDRNFFGIKCFNGSPGTIAAGCHSYQTTECGSNGCYGTTATFRTYATVADSFRDHGNFLRVNKRYKPAFAYTRDADQFIYQVWKAGYATDPNYVSKVRSLMQSYNLYQYDTWR